MGVITYNLSSSDINSVYNYDPAFDNLYTVEIETLSKSGDLSKGLGQDMKNNILKDIHPYVKFHATNVQFNGESLQLERNEVTKNFQLADNAFTRTDTLSITWRESDRWLVKKYHDEWLKLFYDKENDHFWSYPVSSKDGSVTLNNSDIYRTFVITLPGNFSKRGAGGMRGFENKVIFDYVLPKSSAGLNLGWKSNGGVVSHQMEYYVTKWSMSEKENSPEEES